MILMMMMMAMVTTRMMVTRYIEDGMVSMSRGLADSIDKSIPVACSPDTSFVCVKSMWSSDVVPCDCYSHVNQTETLGRLCKTCNHHD